LSRTSVGRRFVERRDEARERRAVREFRTAGRAEREYDFVFVVTYGRSGSTLLQGVLNSIPGFLIRGENHQALRHLFDLHSALEREHIRTLDSGNPTVTSPWFGVAGYPVQGALEEFRRLALALFLRPEEDTKTVGFKEIRWEYEDLGAFIDFLAGVFPGARFVFNTRNLDDVAKSKWWVETPDAREHLQAEEDRLLAECSRLGVRAFRVRYDAFISDPSALKGLFDWLGAPYDDAAVKAVLRQPHSY
jgi:hypothetical protein